jgi:hypothetical protein
MQAAVRRFIPAFTSLLASAGLLQCLTWHCNRQSRARAER